MSDNPRHAANSGRDTIHPHSHDETVLQVPEKDKARFSLEDSEQHILPENRLRIVFPGLMCCIFLAAVDQVGAFSIDSPLPLTVGLLYPQTIVATALPTIVEHIGGGKDYSWVGRFVFYSLAWFLLNISFQLLPPRSQRPCPFIWKVVRPHREKACPLLCHSVIPGVCRSCISTCVFSCMYYR
jgi:hypothetical protein